MEVAEIVEQLRWFNQRFELDAVKAALASREEVTPALLGILEEVAERGAAFDESDDYMAHLYAMFLLAQFRETRAYPLVVRIALLPSDDLELLFGDFVTGNLDSVLASVCGGDLAGIKSIIECETADEWARGAAIDSLLALVAAGVKSREEVVDYFASLYRGKLARVPENEEVWNRLVGSSADLYPEELTAEIERAYADDLVDPRCINLEDVQRDLAKGKVEVLSKLASNPHHQLVNDIVTEFGGWYCFQAKDAMERDESDLEDDFDPWDGPLEPMLPLGPPQGTIRRTGAKIGRNDLCPCGSGKKYKKCCLA
jgi:hypothetical protein